MITDNNGNFSPSKLYMPPLSPHPYLCIVSMSINFAMKVVKEWTIEVDSTNGIIRLIYHK